MLFAVLDPLGLKDMKAEIVEFNALIPGINANASTSSAPACTSARNDARRLPSQIPSPGPVRLHSLFAPPSASPEHKRERTHCERRDRGGDRRPLRADDVADKAVKNWCQRA